MNTKEKIEVMQAWARGEKIQICMDNGWWDITFDEPLWCWDSTQYRIKPKEPREFYVFMDGENGGRALQILPDCTIGWSVDSKPIRVREVL